MKKHLPKLLVSLVLIIIITIFGVVAHHNPYLLNYYFSSPITTTAHGDEEVSDGVKSSLTLFRPSMWDNLSQEKRIEAIDSLVLELNQQLQLNKQPQIIYYEEPGATLLGYFTPSYYTIHINVAQDTDSVTLASVIAHEMRHVWQYARSRNPQNDEDFEFKDNFINYHAYDHDYGSYYLQPLEIDAREYGKHIIQHMF